MREKNKESTWSTCCVLLSELVSLLQLVKPPLIYVLRGHDSQFQEDFDLVLLANNYIQPRVSLAKPVQRFVISEGWADKHDVINLAFEWAAELVHEKLSLARVDRANDQRVEWNIARIHFNTAQIVTDYLQC